MIDLRNLEEIKKLDPKNVYGSTEMFASQCEQIWQDAKSISFDQTYKDIENIIVCGMGGSAYGGYVASSLYKNTLTVPVFSNNDYDLPEFANDKSLIVLSSYSGSTDEVLACAQRAYEKKLKVTGITSGGKLGQLLQSHGSPHLLFNPKFNPSGQPRLGTGYMVLGLLVLLSGAGVLQIEDNKIVQAVEELRKNQESVKSDAIDMAKKLVGFIPVIFSAGFLNGNAHIIRNQFNETSKSFSAFEDLPELNHHLMEGFKNPQDKKLVALFLESGLYENTHKKRVLLT
ncbi:MAG TPA: SIS domain-containing protein, partial [Candidatus Saccharimonadales bacterium]|nr:SIS domain-containing protein [Candidatus Saccharimonadales bacterium]